MRSAALAAQSPNERVHGAGCFDWRRPDIRHLLLNCPNTDTELPYVDLVNELLADKISPPVDGISTSFTQKSLMDGAPITTW